MARELTDWIDSYMEYTEETEPAHMFRRWTAVSVVAAALQRKCYLPWGSLTFYPNMYIILVGPSGSRKGTAMSPGAKLLEEIGNIKLAAQSTTRQALIRSLRTTDYSYIDPITNKTTVHSSLTIFSEEFTVFLGYQNYELMADLCDWFDCKGKWKYETKNMGTDDINGVWVNLIGATTPSLIRSTLPSDSIGGGLTSRIIFVYEEGKAKTVIFPHTPKDLGDKLKNDLERIHMLRGKFGTTEEFLKEWAHWYSTAKPAFKDEKFAGYNERRPTHLMKLAMIMSAARSDKMIVDGCDFRKALELLEATEVKMKQTLTGYGKSNISELIQRAIVYLGTEGKVYKHVMMEHFIDDADRFTMDRVLETLTTMRYAKVVTDATGQVIEFIGPQRVRNSLLDANGVEYEKGK